MDIFQKIEEMTRQNSETRNLGFQNGINHLIYEALNQLSIAPQSATDRCEVLTGSGNMKKRHTNEENNQYFKSNFPIFIGRLH